MIKDLVSDQILFEVEDIFGRKIRTTEKYWRQIKEVKHPELKFGIPEVRQTLKNPEEVRKSVTDVTILLFAKKVKEYGILIVAVKTLNGEGFLVTAYKTKRYKKKGELLWPKQKEKLTLSKAEG